MRKNLTGSKPRTDKNPNKLSVFLNKASMFVFISPFMLLAEPQQTLNPLEQQVIKNEEFKTHQNLSLKQALDLEQTQQELVNSEEVKKPQNWFLNEAQEEQIHSEMAQKEESIKQEEPFMENLNQRDNSSNSLNLKSVLLLQNNRLLKEPYQWAVSIPYTEFTWHTSFLKDNVFELGLELSFQNRQWDYFISRLLFEHTFYLVGLPIKGQWGYFDISYIESNDLLLSKKPLVEQQLFPYGKEALGLALKTTLFSNWSVIVALRSYDYQKASLDLSRRNHKAIGSAHIIYQKGEQQIFAGGFKEDRLGLGPTQSLGLGFDLNYSPFELYSLKKLLNHLPIFPYDLLQQSLAYKENKTAKKLNPVSVKLKAEVWQIQNQEFKSWVWYLFPYVKIFNFVGFGWFVGSLHQDSQQGLAQQSESVFGLDFYLKEGTRFSIENSQEYSTVYSHNTWSFSLKSDLSF